MPAGIVLGTRTKSFPSWSLHSRMGEIDNEQISKMYSLLNVNND